MSGGVDSSVAAYLLKKQGYDVIGVTMQIWQDEDETAMEENGGCCGITAVDDAKRVASMIGIPHYVMNFKKEFQCKVVDYFINEYIAGRTPNPCNACNRYVKWEALLNRGLEIGAEYIATGHYARVKQLDNGRYVITNSATSKKDQTYALYNLTQEQLKRTLMPIGDYTKDEIRQIAADIGLVVANKPDSQDICFVPDNDYAKFITENTGKEWQEGNFVDLQGNVIGKHKGIIHYTIGQRKGLGLSLGKPAFVQAIRPDTNEVVIGDNDELFSSHLKANAFNMMAQDKIPEEGIELLAKVRYSHSGTPAILKDLGNGMVSVDFKEPVRAITPGQAVVLYKDEYVYGGGTIV